MYVVITKRIYKVGTAATQKFAPRSTNRTEMHVAGPFRTQRAAERAALAALSTHTCLGAQVWSRAAVEARLAAGGFHRADEHEAFVGLKAARDLLDAADAAAAVH